VRLFANGVLQTEPVITFRVDSFNERGLLGIAVDPNFNDNHFVYVYYSCAGGADCASPENRVARFVERDGVGANPTIIFRSPVSAPAGQHNGGNIHFGPDGKLYITIGDDAVPANAQDVTNVHGKLHRINPDGSMPTDNPPFAAPGALPSLYALGLRNSFDFTFDPVTPGRIFASENGPGCEDELNRIEGGYNYGWRPDYPCDAANPDPAYNTIAPLWSSGARCCTAPTGITVYTGNAIPDWRNALFMANYQGSELYHFYLNADRTAITGVNAVQRVFATIDIENAPDGTLWYIEGGGNTTDTLKRIAGPTSPPLPTAAPATSPTPAPPAATPVPGTPPPLPGSGSRLFAETGQTVSGLFLSYWDTHGGLAQQGYPIAPLLTEVSTLDGQPYTVQYFERAVFEHHPEHAGTPFEVLLSQLGTYRYQAKYGAAGAPGQTPNQAAGQSHFFAETGHWVGGQFWAYWQAHGGLAQQGYPISDEFTEASDLDPGKTYTVQYFERAVFEQHPENTPPYDVLLAQLGTLRYQETHGSR
jgi:glucose/arabinose dehydrogenase